MSMLRLVPLAALGALALVGCAHTYENRIRSNLVEAGLSGSLASCVAERLVDRLSAGQLQSLARLGRDVDRRGRDMTVEQFLRHYRGALDPQVYEVLARTGIGCAIAG
jgi:hypothetical protein